MSFTILLLSPDADPSWPEKISRAVPGAAAKIYADPNDAVADIETADAAYGTVPPELFARAKRLRWICASRAGLGGAYFYDALVKSDVVVTGMHGSYNEHLSTHAVAFLLAFARRFDHYLPQKRWQRGPGMIDLPTKTVLIVGVGGAGSEASKLCAAFGMRVLGIDPRVTQPSPGMAHLDTPDRLEERLGEADFVIVTTPETPDTLAMFNARLFSRMKRGAYFINIARGKCVVTQDLIAALQSGQLAGAGLDVADPEPLPSDSPLWGMPNVLITPHVAILGTPYRQKWEAILLENCRRFAAGQPLLNVVDKKNGSDFSQLVISAKAEIQAGKAVAVAPGPCFSRRGDDNPLLESARIVDGHCEMLGRLRCGGHQAHPVRRLENGATPLAERSPPSPPSAHRIAARPRS